MELSVLYRDAQTLDARIYPYNIGFAGAATVEVAGRSGIFVDFDRLGSLQEFQAALAHDLGHVPTRCGTRSGAAALHPPLRPTGAKRNSPRGLLSSRARGAKVVQIVNMGYLSPFPLFFLWIICSIDFWRFRG